MSGTQTIEAVSTRVLSDTPKEIYACPHSTNTIRLGNGGAGPCGIFKALAKDYQVAFPDRTSSVAWYQNISPLTLEALHDGKIDLALTYERDQEEEALGKGWAHGPAKLIFNDHFVLVGPKSNPAGVVPNESPQTAFEKILKYGEANPHIKLILSRNDDSATNLKEREIWESIGVTLDKKALPTYYVGHTVFPPDALLEADRDSLYILIDHGTFGMLEQKLKNTQAYVLGGDVLRNPCNALLSPHADEDTKHFLDYLKSPRGQDVIAHFGEELYGTELFTPAAVKDFQPEDRLA